MYIAGDQFHTQVHDFKEYLWRVPIYIYIGHGFKSACLPAISIPSWQINNSCRLYIYAIWYTYGATGTELPVHHVAFDFVRTYFLSCGPIVSSTRCCIAGSTISITKEHKNFEPTCEGRCIYTFVIYVNCACARTNNLRITTDNCVL